MGKGDKIIFSSQKPAGKNIKSMEGTNWEEYKVHGRDEGTLIFMKKFKIVKQ